MESISDDDIEDERRGLMYSARIELAKEILRVGDKDVPLTISMAVRAEVIVDRRRVISFLLNPLQRHGVSDAFGAGSNISVLCERIFGKVYALSKTKFA
ncbi:hypothetical protein P3C22_02070 [Pseudomonas sp. ER28]|uniref:hypothetical protein n=1 Tax=Pseudomonas sp. ER28 TaxID=3033801 RepID=UPI0023DF955A|nr:hypothetical protein [Pseudomonas sp. ER28]MDF3170856.1 hypothetical protein [Pseudomonas sp. ER28]